jgi:hypothetical protein
VSPTLTWQQIREQLRPLEHAERLDWLRLRRHLERQRMAVAAECAAKLREIIDLAVDLDLGRAAGPSQIRRLEVTAAAFDRVVAEANECAECRDKVSRLILDPVADHGLDLSDFEVPIRTESSALAGSDIAVQPDSGLRAASSDVVDPTGSLKPAENELDAVRARLEATLARRIQRVSDEAR